MPKLGDMSLPAGTSTDPTPARLAPVAVEAILLSVEAGRLGFRTRVAPLADGAHPDLLARHLAGLGSPPAGCLLHSTSWRFQDRGIVLTYAVLPDPCPVGPATPIDTDVLARSADPLVPTPPEINPVDVAVHACRHLAFLRHTDSVVAAQVAKEPALWSLVSRFGPAVAGLLATSHP